MKHLKAENNNQEAGCNSRDFENCPFDGNCLKGNVIYETFAKKNDERIYIIIYIYL